MSLERGKLEFYQLLDSQFDPGYIPAEFLHEFMYSDNVHEIL